MIKYFHRSLKGKTLQEETKPLRSSWIYAEAPSGREIKDLAKRFKLEPGYLEDAVDEDEMPRLEHEDGQTYIFVRYAHPTKNGEIDTAPLLIIFGQEHVITVSPAHLPVLDAFRRGRINAATTQRAKLILLMLSQISDQYDIYLNQTSRKIKAIRSRLRGQTVTNQDLIDFVTIEDELNEFLASLLPNNATLRRLLVGRHIPLFEEDQDIVEDLLLNNEQSIEAIRSNLRSISNIRDAYSAISSNNLNRIITLLTLATILIALPNVFFGMYGMNVHLPYQRAHWAFETIIAINLVLIIAIIAFVRKKRII
ncbi:MAG TPA: magnesium transporter CorA family protein [Candidatus Saccharimonadales bacterium]|nr:magnesium transporter CorA family protein [Candidatus Saccharimonadales bacterium]